MDNLINGAVRLCFCRTEFLAAQQKVAAANLPDDFRPHDVQAVARHDTKCRMRCILKVCALSGKDDVAKKRVPGMHGDRSIDDCNHRYFDIEYVLEDLRTLANILDIEVPMIAVINGPVTVHSGYAL